MLGQGHRETHAHVRVNAYTTIHASRDTHVYARSTLTCRASSSAEVKWRRPPRRGPPLPRPARGNHALNSVVGAARGPHQVEVAIWETRFVPMDSRTM